jgi:ATP-dependent Clp protease protease subunit
MAKAMQIAGEHRKALGPKSLAVHALAGQRGSLYIYAPIGDGFWGDCVSAKDVVDQLDAFQKEGCTALDVYVNSEGGSVWDGKAIYEAISRFKGEKTVHVDGLAASAASFIAMAGDKIVCSPAATMMIHDAICMAAGNAADLRATADILEMESASIAGIYARRTKQSVDDVKKMMADTTWMSADKAKALGFCDEIRGDVEDDGDGAEGAEDAAKIPPIMAVATQTQSRIRAARAGVVLAEQKLKLSQNTRASPGSSNPQRPAARK